MFWRCNVHHLHMNTQHQDEIKVITDQNSQNSSIFKFLLTARTTIHCTFSNPTMRNQALHWRVFLCPQLFKNIILCIGTRELFFVSLFEYDHSMTQGQFKKPLQLLK